MNNRPLTPTRNPIFKSLIPLFLLILLFFAISMYAVMTPELSLETPVIETAQAATSINTSSLMNQYFRTGAAVTGDYNITESFDWDISSKTSKGNNAVSDYQYSGTLDGQGNTITITNTSCTNWNSENMNSGNPICHGVLCGILTGTVKNLNIVIATQICLRDANSSSTTRRHIIGIICGRLGGGNIQNCTITINDGKGIDVYCDASGSDHISGCVLGGFAGHTLWVDSSHATSNIINCKMINKGAICGMSTRAQIKNDSIAVGDSWRCAVGGFIGEAWTSTVNLKGCELTGDSTSCIAAYGWRASDAYHQNNKAGGLIGAVNTDCTVNIDCIVYNYPGRIITTYDDKRARVLIGYNYSSKVTATNLIFQGGISTPLKKVSDSTFSHTSSWDGTPSGKSLGNNSATSLSVASNGTGFSPDNSNTLYGNGGTVPTTNSKTYCPAYAYKFGSGDYQSSYGSVSVSIYTANSTSLQSKVTVKISPSSSYIASSVSNGTDYTKLYETYRTNGTAASGEVAIRTSGKIFGCVATSSTASISASNKTYNGSGITGTLSVTPTVTCYVCSDGSNDNWSSNKGTTVTSNKAAGTYKFRCTSSGSSTTAYKGPITYTGNASYPYAVTYAPQSDVSVTISQKEASLSWGTKSWTYDGVSHTPSCSVSNLVSGDSCTVTVSGSQTNVGSWTATANSLSNSNYKLPSSKTASCSITAKEVSLSITTPSASDLTYNGGVTNGNNTVQSSAIQALWKDRIKVTITGIVDSVKVWVYDPNTQSTYVHCKGNSGTADNYKYPLKDTYTVDSTSRARSDYYSLSASSNVFYACACDVGTYSVKILCLSYSDSSGATATSNYTWNSSYNTVDKRALSFTVTKKSLSLTWGDVSYTYDGNSKSAPTAEINSGQMCSRNGTADTCTISSYGGNTSATNAGSSYTVSANLSNTNYQAGSTKTWAISKKSVTITVNNTSCTYGQAKPSFSHNWTSVRAGSDALSGTASYACSYTNSAGNDNRNAGSYDITLSGVSNSNYNITFAGGKLTVNKKQLTIKADDKSVTYGEAAPSYTVTVSGFEYSETTNVLSGSSSASCSYAAGNAVGSQTITASNSYAAHTNYTFSNSNGTLTIGKRSITCTPDNKTINYGDAAPTYSYSITSGSKYGSDNLGTASYTCSYTATAGNNNRNAGSYTISMSGLSNSNYTITQSGTGTLTVNKVALTIKADNKSVTYGGAAPSYTTTVSGFKYSETTSVLSGSSSATCSYAAGNAAGSQTITASNTYATHTNYTFSNSNGTLTIGKKSVTITPSHAAITYGAATPAQNTYSNNWTSVRYGSDTLTGTAVYTCAYNGTAGNANRVVKSYDITMSGVSNDNYTISFGTGSLTVNKKAVTVTAANKSTTYGSAAPAFSVSYSGWEYSETTSVLTNSTVTYSCAYTASAGNANRVVKTYTITPVTTSLAAANYSFTPANGTLTVNKLEVTVTAADKSVTYGDAAPTYTFSYGSFVYSETSSVVSGSVTYSCTYAAGSAATTYTITPVVSGLSADNYSFTAVGGTLTVGKRSITCKPDNMTITYGDAAPTYTYSITSGTKYGSDSLGTASYTCSYNTGAAGTRTATTYTISMSGLSNSNYTITQSGTGTLTVNKFALTVKADNKSITYGEAAPSYTVTVSGYKFSETSSVLSGSGSASCTYAQGNAATTYTITASAGNLSATNYSFTTSNGTLTVGKKAVTITPSHSAITYGAATPAQNTYSNNWNSVRYGSDTLTGTAVYTCAYNGTAGNANRVVKSYDITMTGVSNSNYTITFGTGSLTVNKKQLTVTADDKSATYGDTAPSYSVTITGYVYDEDDAAHSGAGSASSTYTQGNNAGSYTITGSIGTLTAANYSFAAANGTLTVSKRTATLSWTNTSLTYNGSAQKPTCTVSNKYGSSTCDVTVSGEQTDVGSYTATATALSNTTNYQLPGSTTQSFSIGQKAVTIVATAKSSVYGSAQTSLATPTISVGQFYDRDSISLSNTLSATINASAAAGNYTITPTASGTGIGNYNVTATTATYTVQKKGLSVTWTTTSKPYTGSKQSPSYTVTGYVNNHDASSVGLSISTHGANVGNYTATLSKNNGVGANYTFGSNNTNNATASTSFSITAVTLTVTASSHTITYGDDVPSYTLNYSGWVNSETASVLTTAPTASCTYSRYGDAGSYDVTASGGAATNYSFSYTKGTLTVNQLEATLSWSGTTVTYSGSAQTPTCNVTNLVNSDTCTVTVTGGKTAAGSYTVTASELSNSNYVLPAENTHSFTINRAYVTVPTVTIYNNGSTTGTTIEAGGTQHKTYNGLAYSFSCATNNSKYTKSGGSNITNYSSSGSTLTLNVTANYYWGSSGSDSAAKTFKIMVDKVALSVTANANSIIYGDSPAADGYTITGFVNSETSSVVSGSVTYSYNYSQYGNVGSYTITPVTTGLSATNYSFTPVGGTLTVGQKEVGLSWGSTTSWVYDGSSHAPTCSATGNVNSDVIGITVSGAKTAVGSYTATASEITGTKAGNYKLPSANTCSFSITRAYVTRPVVTIYNNGSSTSTTITAGGSQSKTYNNKAYTLNYSTPSGTSASATNNNTMTAVGSIVLTFTIDGNHYWKTADGVSTGTDTANKVYTLNVTAKSISGATVTLGDSYQYNGSARTQSVSSVTIDGLTATFSVSNNVQTNAGNYTLTVSGTGNFTGTKDVSWSISRAYVTVPTVSIYKGGAAMSPSRTIAAGSTEDVDYDGSTYTFNYTAQNTKYTPTGGSSITSKGTTTLTLNVTDNYYWGSSGSDSAAKSFSIHVTSGGAVIVLSHAAITYGDAKPTSGFSASIKVALAGGETLEGVTINQSDFNVTSYSAGSNVGGYTITISGTSKSNIESRLSNYEVDYEGTLNVGQKSLTLSWTNVSKAYTGLAQGPSVSISSGKYGSDDVTVSCNTPQTVVGSSTATATLGGTKKTNYTMSNGTTTFTVTKATLTVTANANTITYGSVPAANGYTITGYVNSETSSVVSGSVTYTYNYSQYDDVGNYTITPVVTSLSATNYSFSPAGGTLTVSQKAATVTAENKSTTYGSAAPAFTYTTSGLVNSDTLSGTISYTCSYTATAGNANRVAGKYDITPSGLSNSNYAITFEKGQLTVGKKTVTVSWGTKTWTYDALDHLPTATIGDTKYNESVTVSTYGGDTQVNVGASYPVSVTAISNSANYQLPTDGSAATTFSITAATLTVTADNKTVTYGAAVPTYTSTITGYKGSDTESVITGSVTYSCTYAQYSAVTTYTITPVVTGLSATNYVFGTTNGTLTVNRKTATVTADNKTITYGEAKPSFTYTTSGLVNSDTLSGTISYACDYKQTQGDTNSTVGDYSITPSGLSNDNYTITFTPGTLTVNQKAVTLSWSASSYVYDGSTHIPTATVTVGSKGYAGDTVTVASYSGTTAAQKNVNSYTTSANSLGGTNGGNYTLTGGTNVSKTWSITAKSVTVTVNNVSVVYGSAKPSFTNNWDTVKIGSDTLTGSASYSCDYTASAGNANRVVGDYDITLSGLSNSNYSITFAKGTLTVTQKEVALTWGSLSFTYDATSHCPVVTSVTETVYGETVTVSTYSGSSHTDVGSDYTVSATALSNSNYKLPTDGSATKTWAITAKGVTLTWTNYSLPYTGSAQSPNVSISSGNLDGANLTVSTSASLTNVSSTTASATLGGSAAGNYTISSGATHSFAITALDIEDATITLSGSFTYDSTEKTVTISSVTKSGLNVTYSVYNNSNKATTAGSHTLTINGNGNFTGTATKTWSIAALDITGATITTSGSFTYDKTEKTLTVSSVTKSGLTVTYTINNNSNKATTAGNHTLRVDGTGNFTGYATKTWNIAKRAITITWKLDTVTNKTSTVYTGSAHTVTATAGNVVDGDTVNITLSDYSGTDVADHQATATAVSNSNYSLPASGTTYDWSITTKTLTFSISVSASYTYDANIHGATVSFSGIVSGQKLNWTMRNSAEMTWTSHDNLASNATRTTSGAGWNDDSTNATAYGGANVGSYGITIVALVSTDSGNADNYAIGGTTSASWSITPASVTVTANAQSITYGDAPANNGFTYGSFQGTDTSSVVTGGVGYTYNYTRYDNIGSYTITPDVSALRADNYTFTPVAGTLTVNAYTVSISWGDTAFVYNGSSQAPTCTVDDPINDDVLSVTVTGGQVNARVAAYTATASTITGTKAGNYALPAGNTTTFTISKAVLTIAAKDCDVMYGDAAPEYETDISGFVGSDDEDDLTGSLSVTSTYVASSGNANRAVGSYTITPTGYTSTNYDINYLTGTLSVAKRVVTLNWNASSWVYNASSHRPSATVGNTAYNESVTVSAYSGDSQVNVGSGYVVYASTLSDSTNYVLPETNWQVYSITARSLTVTITPGTSLAYTSSSKTVFTVTATGLQGSETLTFNYTHTGLSGSSFTLSAASNSTTFSKTDAGSYELNIGSISDGTGFASNYSLASAVYSSTSIAKATLSWGAPSYSGATVSWSAPTGLQGSDSLTFAYTVAGAAATSPYTATSTGVKKLAVSFTGSKAGNYNAIPEKTLLRVYSVTFMRDAEKYPSHASTVNYVFRDQTVSAPSTWALDGYDWLGWRVGSEAGETYNASAGITQDLIVYASYRIPSVSDITFKFTLSATPTAEDFTFEIADQTVALSADIADITAISLETPTTSPWFVIRWYKNDPTCNEINYVTSFSGASDGDTFYAKLVLNIASGDMDGDGDFDESDKNLYRQYLAGGYDVTGLATVSDMFNVVKPGGTYDNDATYCLLPAIPYIEGQPEYTPYNLYVLVTKLNDPVLTVNGDSGIIWAEVERATKYSVSVDGGAWTEYSASSRSVSFSTEIGAHSIAVKALDGASGFSEVVTYEYTTADTSVSDISKSGRTASWTMAGKTVSFTLGGVATAYNYSDGTYSYTVSASAGTYNMRATATPGFDSTNRIYYSGSTTYKDASITVSKLATPSLSVSGTNVVWSAISNATSYYVSVDGDTAYSTTSRSVALSSTTGSHSVEVYAVSTNPLYLDSNHATHEYETVGIPSDWSLAREADSFNVYWEVALPPEVMALTIGGESQEFSTPIGGYHQFNLENDLDGFSATNGASYAFAVTASSTYVTGVEKYYYTASSITKNLTVSISKLATPSLSATDASTAISWASISNAQSYSVKVDNGSWTSQNGRSYSFPSTVGQHTVYVKATSSDPACLESNVASITFTTTTTTLSSITFKNLTAYWTANARQVSVKEDSGSYNVTTLNYYTLSDTAAKTYTVYVRAAGGYDATNKIYYYGTIDKSEQKTISRASTSVDFEEQTANSPYTVANGGTGAANWTQQYWDASSESWITTSNQMNSRANNSGRLVNFSTSMTKERFTYSTGSSLGVANTFSVDIGNYYYSYDIWYKIMLIDTAGQTHYLAGATNKSVQLLSTGTNASTKKFTTVSYTGLEPIEVQAIRFEVYGSTGSSSTYTYMYIDNISLTYVAPSLGTNAVYGGASSFTVTAGTPVEKTLSTAGAADALNFTLNNSTGTATTVDVTLYNGSYMVATGSYVMKASSGDVSLQLIFNKWRITKFVVSSSSANVTMKSISLGTSNSFAVTAHNEYRVASTSGSTSILLMGEEVKSSATVNYNLTAIKQLQTYAADVSPLFGSITNIKQIISASYAQNIDVMSNASSDSTYGTLTIKYIVSGSTTITTSTITVKRKASASLNEATRDAYSRNLWKEISIDPHQVVLAGSSSMEKWERVGQDMKGIAFADVGIGGTVSTDWSMNGGLAERFIYAYNPRAVILFVGVNDLKGGSTVSTTESNVQALLTQIHTKLPNAKVYYVLINKVPLAISGSNYLTEANVTAFNNDMITYANSRDWLTTIALDTTYHMVYNGGSGYDFNYNDTTKAYAKTSNYGKTSFFDSMHLNQAGYTEWAYAIRKKFLALDKKDTWSVTD